jgi:hypothetical protein
MERVYAGILHGVAANTMYQGFRSVQKLPIGEFMRVQYGGHFQYLTIQGYVNEFPSEFSSSKFLHSFRLALAGFSMVLGMVTGLFPWAIGEFIVLC